MKFKKIHTVVIFLRMFIAKRIAEKYIYKQYDFELKTDININEVHTGMD